VKVLVTGASGFIGREVTKRLCERRFEVHAVARKSLTIADEIWHELDLFDSGAVDNLMRQIKPTHLVHLAWTTEPGQFWNSPENHDWERASKHLFDSFTAHGGKRFVGAGTCAEYEWNEKLCRESDADSVPSTVYGQSKLSTWKYVDSRSQETGAISAWGRIFWLYGPHEHPSRLVPHVIKSILAGRHVDCTSGEQLRDFMHVSDVAESFVRLTDSQVTGPINIASGNAVAVREVVLQIASQMSGEQLVRLGALPTKASEPHVVAADVQRLTSLLSFRPSVSLSDGLNSTISWIKSVSAAAASK